MNPRLFPTLSFLIFASALAAEAPKPSANPAKPIAVKKELLFSDDIKVWNDGPAHK